MTDGLKPCPFCGESNHISARGGAPDYASWWIECEGCLTEGPAAETKAEAIVAWNRRILQENRDV